MATNPPKPSHQQQQQQHPPIRLPSKWAVSIGTGQLPFDDGSHEVTPADSASSSESPAGRRGRERDGGGGVGGWVDGCLQREMTRREADYRFLHNCGTAPVPFGPLRAGFSWFLCEIDARDQMSPDDSRAPRWIQVS